MSTHLDLGCGPVPRNPYQRDVVCGIDIRSDMSADPRIKIAVANLSLEPIPFPNDYFDSVSAYDFLEHVPRVSLDHTRGLTTFPFVNLMNEIWRVLKPNGLFYSVAPAFAHPLAFADPTHVNIMTTLTSRYFTGATPMGRMYGFTGQFEQLRQAVIHPRKDYHPRQVPLKLRLKMLGDTVGRRRSHLMWEWQASK